MPESFDFKCECKPGFNGTGMQCTGKTTFVSKVKTLQKGSEAGLLVFFSKVIMASNIETYFVCLFPSPLDVCEGFCENSGQCVKDIKGIPSCRCKGSFTGTKCSERSEFAYIAGGIAATVIFIILIVLLIWMICARYGFNNNTNQTF